MQMTFEHGAAGCVVHRAAGTEPLLLLSINVPKQKVNAWTFTQ